MKTAVFLFLCVASSTLAQVGATIDSLTMRNSAGTELTLTHCKVTKVEPDGVRVTHDGGIAKVPFAAMPEAWKAAAPVDAAKVKEFQEQERLKAAKYAEWAKSEKQKAFEAEEIKKDPAKKAYFEAQHQAAETRKKRTNDLLEFSRKLFTEGKATQEQLSEWAKLADEKSVCVGMPEPFAEASLNYFVERTSSSDGLQVWRSMGLTIFLRDGKVTRWINTN